MATSRTAPGGKATVVLGDDSLNYVTDSGALGAGSAAAVATMEARVRQAPGGTTSIAFGGDADKSLTAEELLARPSPGGAASIDLSADKAAPAMATRGPPGGQTTIILGSDAAALSTNSSAHGVGCADAAAATAPRVRSAPGGKTSVNFGAEHEAPSVEDLLSRQAPGGVDSVSFAPGAAEATPVRGPVGGQTTVFLGKDTSDWSTSKSIHGVGSVEAIMATPAKARPAPGGEASIDFAATTPAVLAGDLLVRPSPGGAASIDFGAPAQAPPPSSKGPVGGETTILLGQHASDWSTNSAAHGEGSVEAIASAEPRERPAPGGVDSVAFGASAAAVSKEALLARPFPGGAASLDFAAQVPPIDPSIIRGPVGGEASVQLGAHGADWSTNSAAVGVGSADAVAQAGPRGPRPAPGGAASIEFGKAADTESAETLLARPSPGGPSSVDFTAQPEIKTATKGPVGGTATVVLGADGSDWITNSSTVGVGSASAVATAAAEIAAATGQLRPAPGGNSAVCLGGSDTGPNVETLLTRPSPGGTATIDFAGDHGHVGGSTRGYPGGPSSLVLGGDSITWAGKSSEWSTSASSFNADAVKAAGGLEGKTADGRQAPGGTSTLVLGGGVDDVAPAQVSSNRFADGKSQNTGNFITDRPSTKLHQAPGGTSSIVLGGDPEDVQPMQSSNAFATGSDPNAGNVLSDKPSIHLQQAPGGNSSIVLGGDTDEVSVTRDSSNKFANGSCQNTGNVLSERPTTKLHQAPGGNSTIVLGCDEELSTDKPSVQVQQAPGGLSSIVLGGDAVDATESSNKFANGSNQNAGNVLTDRSSTKLLQVPGGTSSIVLGVDADEVVLPKQPCSKEDDQERTGTNSNRTGAAGGLGGKQSSNRFANGSSQNTGNFITDRPTTKLHQAPGGRSTICLGTDSDAITMGKNKVPIQDENADANKQVASANAPAVVLG